MADGHFQHTRHSAQESAQVVAAQVVAGVHTQALRLRGRRRCREGLQLRALPGLAKRGCVGLGVKLDAIRAHGTRQRHRCWLRVHEQAHAHAQRVALSDQRAQAFTIGHEIPAVV